MQWEENKHPRDSDGKFTDGGGTPAENKRLEELGIIKPNENTNNQLTADEQKLKECGIDIKELDSNLDKILNGTYNGSHLTLCKKTPKVFCDLGVPNNPIMITEKHAYLAMNEKGKYIGSGDHYHNLGKETFKLIPGLLQSPMMVLQSQENKSDIISVLNWYDKNKDILICPMRINGYGKCNEISIKGNIVKSVYGKQNIENYINNHFGMTDILYAANKKIRDLQK